MNAFSIFSLKVIRKLYQKTFRADLPYIPECNIGPDSVSQKIYEALVSDKPCMIARFGANELALLINYQSINSESKSIIKYIKGEQFDWWWNEKIIRQLHEGAGFFPPEIPKLDFFCKLMIQDIPFVDILGSWLSNEKNFEKELENSQKVPLRLLEPFWTERPWTRALEGKKVLVVHPFANDIENQYKRKELLFKNFILPDFQIKTIKAVLSLAHEKTGFDDWFGALKYMKDEIDNVDYDICLIGAGAYGFHLAAHVKRMGKKSFHLGGALQLLFGIRGKRWDDPNYGIKEWGIPYGSYTSLFNKNWVYPDPNEKPSGANLVEGGCYW